MHLGITETFTLLGVYKVSVCWEGGNAKPESSAESPSAHGSSGGKLPRKWQ